MGGPPCILLPELLPARYCTFLMLSSPDACLPVNSFFPPGKIPARFLPERPSASRARLPRHPNHSRSLGVGDTSCLTVNSLVSSGIAVTALFASAVLALFWALFGTFLCAATAARCFPQALFPHGVELREQQALSSVFLLTCVVFLSRPHGLDEFWPGGAMFCRLLHRVCAVSRFSDVIDRASAFDPLPEKGSGDVVPSGDVESGLSFIIITFSY